MVNIFLPFLKMVNIEVRYTCVANLHSYCGGRVEAGGGPGYLASPGYVGTSNDFITWTGI